MGLYPVGVRRLEDDGGCGDRADRKGKCGHDPRTAVPSSGGSQRGGRGSLECSLGGIDAHRRVCVPCIQSALCALFCGDGGDQTGDEQCKVVLVCNRLSVPVCLCDCNDRIQDRRLILWRAFRLLDSRRVCTAGGTFVSAA